MGVAAYNRGSAALSRRLDAEQRPQLFRFFDALLERSKHAEAELRRSTIVRIDERGRAWLMSRADNGWSEFGYSYKNVWHLAKAWRVAFTGVGRDKHSPYFQVEPL